MNLQEPSAAMAFGLGLWTAVQPCPMTANLAAVSYLGRRAGSSGSALFASLLYAAGQMIAYVSLALAVLEGIASAWRLSEWLQQHVNQVLGPIWILTAMVLLDLLRFRLPGVRVGPKWQSKIDAWGAWSALPLGVVLALGFCPVSATIFFVDLLTIAVGGGSRVLYPALYALGAALPVLAIAILLGAGSRWLGSAQNRTQQVQRWLNWAAGGALLAVGIYYALKFNFEVLPF
ncbi:MAG: aromatic aminobenezylarsenical efflux permease ArsG family transporter [Thermoguttaceae bacterium]|jgi:cytochrome c biogenesis protein CcdA